MVPIRMGSPFAGAAGPANEQTTISNSSAIRHTARNSRIFMALTSFNSQETARRYYLSGQNSSSGKPKQVKQYDFGGAIKRLNSSRALAPEARTAGPKVCA